MTGSRQGSRERTIAIPPFLWWLMLLGGIALGFIFGIPFLQLMFTFLATVFTLLGAIVGSLIAIVILLLLLWILRGFWLNFVPLIFGIILGIILGIVVVAMGLWSPIEPASTDLPSLVVLLS